MPASQDFPLEVDTRHYHLAWGGMLVFTIEGLRFYREAAARAGVVCHWARIRSLADLLALHRALATIHHGTVGQ